MELYNDSKAPATDTKAAKFKTNTENRTSKHSFKSFKDIDINSIKEDTQLIQKESKTIGPLDRKDIFYSGSLLLLPEYRDKRSQKDTETVGMPINYHLSMIHEPNIRTKSDKGWCHCNISHMIKNALRLLFDVSILKSPAFLTFAMSNFFYVFALYVPYMFIKSKFLIKRRDRRKRPV